ncbi:hypothetical protein [Serratia liquefaciens]|uniref:hypothetical protein n=1 Tax=Serratia liquefaciens TaxID=614 RepID=UPI0022B9EE6E|nr:hypothetical protein [Serratia liquefaciens]
MKRNVLRLSAIATVLLGGVLLLAGCPETPEKSLREQVKDAERISGYDAGSHCLEGKDGTNCHRLHASTDEEN